MRGWEDKRISFLSGLPRHMVVRAHQEQLDEMAELGFKEETLMTQLASKVSSLGWTLGAVGNSLVASLLWCVWYEVLLSHTDYC